MPYKLQKTTHLYCLKLNNFNVCY